MRGTKTLSTVLLVLAAFAFLASGTVQAELIAYEGFDYFPPWSNLEDSGNGGVGWSGSWTNDNPSTNNAWISGDLAFSDLETSGNSLWLQNNDGGTAPSNPNWHYVSRKLDTDLTSGVVWCSFLYWVYDGSVNLFEMQAVQMHTNIFWYSSSDGTRRFRVFCKAYSSTAGNLVINETVYTNIGVSGTHNFSDGNIYLFVSRYDLGDPNGRGETWVLRESDFDQIAPAVRSATVTTNDLNAHNYAKATMPWPNQTIEDQYVTIGSWSQDATCQAQYDEYRLGTTLLDVVPARDAVTRSVYEPFAYPLGSELVLRHGGEGWQGVWNRYYYGNLSGTLTNGLTFGELSVTGNAVRVWRNNADVTYSYSRKLRVLDYTNQDLYISWLYREPYTVDHVNEAFGTQISTEQFAHEEEWPDWHRKNMMFPKGYGVTRPRMGSDNHGGLTDLGTDGVDLITDGDTYLLVSRWAMGDPSGTCHMWVLRKSHFTNITEKIRAGSITTNDLNSNCYLHGGTAYTSASVLDDYYFHMTVYTDNGAGCDMVLDEIRLDTSITGVLPLFPPIGTMFYVR